MRISRFLLPGCVLALWASPLLAQPGGAAGLPDPLIPSVRPAGAEELAPGPLSVPQPPGGGRPRMSAGRPAPPVASLEQMTTAQPAQADPVGTLTGVPSQPVPAPGVPYGQYGPGLPPGTYPSPYYVDGPGCCGPLGANGRIGYELYSYAGANVPFGRGLAERLNTGWTVGGGTRTLFFDPTYTSAWVVDLGLSYTHNWGAGSKDPETLFLRQSNQERVGLAGIRGVHRTSFNFNFGRDVWLMGCGNNGGMQGTNVRVGAWVGGRWGTAHVDLDPLDEFPGNGYARRQNAFEGFVVGSHITWDTPMGGWILFGGLRAEYGYDWTNLVPPIQGNINNVNIQASLGVRF
jgi:hypothetical protein